MPEIRIFLLSFLLCSLAAGADQKSPEPTAKTQTVTASNRCAQFEGPADYIFEAVTDGVTEGRSITTGKGPDKSSMTLMTFEKKTTEATAREVLDMISEKFGKTTTAPKESTLDGMPVLVRKFRMQGKESVVTLQFAVFTGPTHFIALWGTCPEAALSLRQPQFEMALATVKSLTPPAAKQPPPSPPK